jgi:hypothetical protein
MHSASPSSQRYPVNHAVSRQHNAEDNGLFASKRLERGELILQLERPMLTALDINILGRACEWCFAFPEAASLDQWEENGAPRSSNGGCAGEQRLLEDKATIGQGKQEARQAPVKLRKCGGCSVVWFCRKVGLGTLFLVKRQEDFVLVCLCRFRIL